MVCLISYAAHSIKYVPVVAELLELFRCSGQDIECRPINVFDCVARDEADLTLHFVSFPERPSSERKYERNIPLLYQEDANPAW